MRFAIGSRSRRIGRSSRFVALAALVLGARIAPAENLVTNGDFDSSIDGWDPGTVASFLAEDWQGDPSSGSLRIVNDLAEASSVQASQCVALTGTDPLIFSGALRGALTGDTTTGRVRIGVSWRTAADCDVSSVVGSYLFAVTVDAPVDWTVAASDPATPPEGAVAADVQLIATKTAAGGSLTADFDAITVPEPTTAASGACAFAASLALARARRRTGA